MYEKTAGFAGKVHQIRVQGMSIQEKDIREITNARNILEEYLLTRNGEAFGVGKQEVLNAIKSLNLTGDASKQIRNNLENKSLQRSVGDGNDISLVIFVMRKLKTDHHSKSSFHFQPTRAYQEVKHGLDNIADKVRLDIRAKGPMLFHKHRYFFLSPGSKLDRKSLEQAIQAGADLRYVDLSGQDLRGLDLSKLDLEGVILSRAKLDPAGLQRAIDCGADLEGVDLTEQDLRQINWRLAVVKGAILQRAKIRGEDIGYLSGVGADLRRVDLSRQNLRGIDPGDANLEGAILEGSSLDKQFFVQAIRSGADVRWVDLTAQDLRGIDLRAEGLRGRRVDLHGAVLTRTDMRGLDLRQVDINFSRTRMNGANLNGTKINQEIFEQVIAANGNLRGVDLSEQYLFDVQLPYGHDRVIDLEGANLSMTMLEGNWLRFVRAPNAKINAETRVLMSFSRNSDADFNHINNRAGSFLTFIDSIDDRNAGLKESLMRQVCAHLGGHMLTNIEPLIDKLLNSSFDYSVTMNGYPKFKGEFLQGVVNRGNHTALPLVINGLRQMVEIHLMRMSRDEREAFMFRNNNCFIQLVHQGLGSDDLRIRRFSESLYKEYVNHPNVKSVYELASAAVCEDYMIFTQGKNHFAVSHRYMDKFLYRTGQEHVISWQDDRILFKNGKDTYINNLGSDVFEEFTLFLNSFRYEKERTRFVGLLDLLDLGGDREHFMRAIDQKSSDIKLCGTEDRERLDKTFDRFYARQDMGKVYGGAAKNAVSLSEKHVQEIINMYEMRESGNREQAALLLLLGGIFAIFSSSAHFGTSYDSPDALRKYAYGLMRAAREKDATIVPQDQFNGWANRFFGIGPYIECTAMLSEEIIAHCRSLEGFEQHFAGVIPLAWE